MNPLLSLRNSEIEKVILTPEEERMAIWGAKFSKWNAERHKEYWRELEEKRPNQAGKGIGKIN